MRILIAEDDPVSRHILNTQLSKWGHEVIVTTNGLDAWEALNAPDAPLIAILDWMMPGIDGVDVCRRLRQQQNDSPVYMILLTALSAKEKVIEGLESGADDYMTKPFDRHELRVRLNAGLRIVELQVSLHQRVKELEQAIVERQQAEEALRNLTLTDPMTSLYNYRGFYTLAEQAMKVARRSQQKSLLVYADMDGLKQINDTLGHDTGALALQRLADIIRSSFRDCDIVARIGGDEFLVLAPNVSNDQSDQLIERLRANIDAHNGRAEVEFALGLSLGAVILEHDSELTLHDQIAIADREMYRDKQMRKNKTFSGVKPPQSQGPILSVA